MEPSPIARALESLAGPWLSPLVSASRWAAWLALLLSLILCVLRAARALAAWRYGWERAIVVSCPRCGKLASDPLTSSCPEGHPVRFPPGAAQRARRNLAGPWRTARRVYALALPVAAGLASIWAFGALRPGRARLSISVILASVSYLFFAAALFCATWALSPAARGTIGRALHLALAALCLIPVVVLLLCAELVEPPSRDALGALWRTPTATYLSVGRRARRMGPSIERIDAMLVEARVPAVGALWQGLEGFRLGGTEVVWRGPGGWLARRLEHWAAPLSAHGVWLARVDRTVVLPPDVKLWIVRDRRRLAFLREEELAMPEIPAPQARRGGSPF